MQQNWDLTPLYRGFDDPVFLQDVEALRAKAAELVAFVPTLDSLEHLEGLQQGTRLLEEMAGPTDRLMNYLKLRLAANTGDAEATAWQGKINTISASAAGAEATYKQWAGKLPELEALIEQDPVLRQYRFYYTQLADSCRYLMSGDREETLAAMNIPGAKAWVNMRAAVTGHAKADYRGKSLTLVALRNLAFDADQEVRREGFEAELACYEPIKEPIAHALNAIKTATNTEARMRGYASALDWTLKNDRMQQATVDAMFSAVKESLPQLQRFLKAKAKYLGHENGLPWYDISAPIGGSAGTFTPEECRDYLLKQFYAFDEELGNMMDTAFRDAWIDFHPRPGKRDGAFCSSSRSMGRSWIHANYTGSFGSMKTIAHELGHAFHNVCVREHRPLNKKYGRPVSETASIFNECVVYGAALAEAADPQQELALINTCLNSDVTSILDIYSRFLFEDEVFRRVADEFLTADELCQIMVHAQKAAFGDSLDPQHLHPYMWICKPHYYNYYYYNYPYIFGNLFSHGLYALYKAEGESFVPKYKKLLYTTSVATAEDAAKVAGIDLTDKAFWKQSLDSFNKMIDRFCQLTEA